jgi:hypothetical protein
MQPDELANLKKVLELANYRNVLIFRAADILDSNNTSYSDLDAGIRIGTTPDPKSGQMWRRLVEDADFSFPGEESLVESVLGGVLSDTKLKSPNTLATAVACGVATLILYCIRLVDDPEDTQYAMSRSKMRKILGNTVIRDDGQRHSEFWRTFNQYDLDHVSSEAERAFYVVKGLVGFLCRERKMGDGMF